MCIEMLVCEFVMFYQLNGQSVILLPTQSTFYSSQTREKALSAYPPRNHVSFQTEDKQSVRGVCHAVWEDHSGGILSANIYDVIVRSCPVQQNETTTHISLHTPWSPTVFIKQSNLKLLDNLLAQQESIAIC